MVSHTLFPLCVHLAVDLDLDLCLYTRVYQYSRDFFFVLLPRLSLRIIFLLPITSTPPILSFPERLPHSDLGLSSYSLIFTVALISLLSL